MSLPIQPTNIFFKQTAPSIDEQISEINKKVKNLIKNIDGLNNSSCCQHCSVMGFREIENSRVSIDQKIQTISSKKMSLNQKKIFDYLIQKSASTGSLLIRKFESLPQVCFRGLVRATFLKQEHSWTQIVPCVAILGIGAAASHPFRLGILAGLVDYIFSVTSMFFYLKHFPLTSSVADSEDNKKGNHSWIQIVPYIVAAGIGLALTQPAFNAGIPVVLPGSTLAMTALTCYLKYFHPSPSIAYSNLYIHGLLKPLNEEVMFRGIIQKLVCNVTGSPLAGIIVSAGMFGAEHLENDHKLAVFQSISAVFSGVLYGILNHQLGLAAPFGAHAMNNLLACK